VIGSARRWQRGSFLIKFLVYAAWVPFYCALFGGIGLGIGGALGWLADSVGIGNSSDLSTVGLGTGTGLIAGALVGFVAGVTRFSQRARVAALLVTTLVGATVFLFSNQTLAEDSPWLLGLATAIGAFAVMVIMSPASRGSLRYFFISVGICALIAALIGAILGWGKYAGDSGFLMSAWIGATIGLVPGTIVGLTIALARDNRRLMIFALVAIAVVDFAVSIYIIYSRVGEGRSITPFFGAQWPSEIFALVLPISIYWAAIFTLIYVAIQSYRARSAR